jgi:hypothetical protein
MVNGERQPRERAGRLPHSGPATSASATGDSSPGHVRHGDPPRAPDSANDLAAARPSAGQSAEPLPQRRPGGSAIQAPPRIRPPRPWLMPRTAPAPDAAAASLDPDAVVPAEPLPSSLAASAARLIGDTIAERDRANHGERQLDHQAGPSDPPVVAGPIPPEPRGPTGFPRRWPPASPLIVVTVIAVVRVAFHSLRQRSG